MLEHDDQDGAGGEPGLREGADSAEISVFVNELVTMQRASAFADELYGSPWDVAPARGVRCRSGLSRED